MKQTAILVLCFSVVAISLADGKSVDLSENIEEVESLLESLKELDVNLRMNQLDRDTGLTYQEQNDVMNTHNTLRLAEGASNMYKMKWNETLAVIAKSWADGCVYAKGQIGVDATTLGQNIWANADLSLDIQTAVSDWYSEKSNYDYDSATCNGNCDSYLTVVWSATSQVGCAKTFCPSINNLDGAVYFVCNYWTPGNVPGVQPYLKGPQCSKCGKGQLFCNKGLCDPLCTAGRPGCQCAVACKNGGMQQSSDCTCHCAPGFTGPNCLGKKSESKKAKLDELLSYLRDVADEE